MNLHIKKKKKKREEEKKRKNKQKKKKEALTCTYLSKTQKKQKNLHVLPPICQKSHSYLHVQITEKEYGKYVLQYNITVL